ncbi:hypothetical protein PanWU01x14_244870, partial [Parasponia andersonii]
DPVKVRDKTNDQVEDNIEPFSEQTQDTMPASEVEKPKSKLFLDNPPPYVPLIPYPQRFQKQKLD